MKNIIVNVINNITYILSDLTEEQFNIIVENKQNKEFIINDIYLKNVVLLGRIENENAYLKFKPFLQSFIHTCHGEKQLHYRNYINSFEKQYNIAWLINQCPDSIMSFNSLKKKINSKYVVLWKQY